MFPTNDGRVLSSDGATDHNSATGFGNSVKNAKLFLKTVKSYFYSRFGVY